MAEGWPGPACRTGNGACWMGRPGATAGKPHRAGSSVRTFGFGLGPACGEGILAISLRNI